MLNIFVRKSATVLKIFLIAWKHVSKQKLQFSQISILNQGGQKKNCAFLLTQTVHDLHGISVMAKEYTGTFSSVVDFKL